MGDIVTSVLVLTAALMCFAAGVGLLRLRDVLSRLHAATKPQILGLIAIGADVAINNPSIGTVTLVIAIVLFQALTAPIAAHMVARGAYRGGNYAPELLIRDDLFARGGPPD